MRRKIPADPSRLVESPPGNSLNSVHITSRSTAEQAAINVFGSNPPAIDWEQRGQITALAYCRARGYPRAVDVATIPVPNVYSNPEGWGYTEDLDSRPDYWTFAAYQIRQWTATCVKRERRR